MTTPPLNTAATFIHARNIYWVALAAHQVTEEKDRASKQAVLDSHVFVSAKDDDHAHDRITNPDHDYLMPDDDFTRYLKLVHEERLKRGLRLPYENYEWSKDEPWNLSADVETRPILRNAEDHLIDCGLDLTPTLKADLERCRDLYDLRQKYLDLLCHLDLGDHPTAKTVLASIDGNERSGALRRRLERVIKHKFVEIEKWRKRT